MKKNEDELALDCRLDKWLWAARFFKTRRLASESIKKGCISIEGKVSIKPSSAVIPDNIIVIQNDYLKQKIIVKKVAFKRGSYEKARLLYTILEEEKSEAREYFEKRLAKKRPTKQERRELISIKNSSNYISNS